jgi:hypothetical protein
MINPHQIMNSVKVRLPAELQWTSDSSPQAKFILTLIQVLNDNGAFTNNAVPYNEVNDLESRLNKRIDHLVECLNSSEAFNRHKIWYEEAKIRWTKERDDFEKQIAEDLIKRKAEYEKDLQDIKEEVAKNYKAKIDQAKVDFQQMLENI